MLVAGCASSTGSLRENCERDPAHDPKCVEVLTTPEYESREEVLRREQARKDDAEDDRLARMRRDEEARQATRTGTTTGSMDELAPADAAILSSSTGKEEEIDSGSSVRAL